MYVSFAHALSMAAARAAMRTQLARKLAAIIMGRVPEYTTECRYIAGMSGNLDAEICDEHLETISCEYLTDWQKLRPHLGLSYTREMEISKSAKDSYGDQKRSFLYAWKQEKGSEATYQALITVAIKKHKVSGRR